MIINSHLQMMAWFEQLTPRPGAHGGRGLTTLLRTPAMRMMLIVLLACLPVRAASGQNEKDKDEERAIAEIMKLGGVVKVDRKSNRVFEVDFAKPGLKDEGLKHLTALKEQKALPKLEIHRIDPPLTGWVYFAGQETNPVQEMKFIDRNSTRPPPVTD